jgi:hypothetical protein
VFHGVFLPGVAFCWFLGHLRTFSIRRAIR